MVKGLAKYGTAGAMAEAKSVDASPFQAKGGYSPVTGRILREACRFSNNHINGVVIRPPSPLALARAPSLPSGGAPNGSSWPC